MRASLISHLVPSRFTKGAEFITLIFITFTASVASAQVFAWRLPLDRLHHHLLILHTEVLAITSRFS